MIVDSLENVILYLGISEQIKEALEFLEKTNFSEIEDGRYSLEGTESFYMVQRYHTKPYNEGRLETHQKYIDIQLIVTGHEIIGHALRSDDLEVLEPYKAEQDIAFYKQAKHMSQANLQAGMFGIFFPHDAHMPCRQAGDAPEEVLKVVVKVPCKR